MVVLGFPKRRVIVRSHSGQIHVSLLTLCLIVQVQEWQCIVNSKRGAAALCHDQIADQVVLLFAFFFMTYDKLNLTSL